MKKRIYLPLSIVVISFLLWQLINMHTPFVWLPSIDHDSREPFGAALFDKLMEKSLPKGYDVKEDIPEELDPDTDAILYCKYALGAYRYGYSNYESETKRAKKIMDFVKRGGDVIVSVAYIEHSGSEEKDSLLLNYDLTYKRNRLVDIKGGEIKETWLIKEDTWSQPIEHGHEFHELSRINAPGYALQPLIKDLKDNTPENDTLTWADGHCSYTISPIYAVGSELYNLITRDHEVMMTYKYEHWHEEALAFRRQYKSGGSITFVATPLLFTNYAVMDPVAIQLTQRLLTPVKDKHLVRIEGKNLPDKVKMFANNDEFSFLRKNRSLRYGFYLLISTLVLAFINYSRRRIRAIPLLPEEKNMTLDFARFMGTFHYRRHDYKQVVLSQYETMLHLLGETMVRDVNRLNSTELKEVIVDKTHLPPADVGMLIRTVGKLRDTDLTIDQKDMMNMLDIIRKIKQHITKL